MACLSVPRRPWPLPVAEINWSLQIHVLVVSVSAPAPAIRHQQLRASGPAAPGGEQSPRVPVLGVEVAGGGRGYRDGHSQVSPQPHVRPSIPTALGPVLSAAGLGLAGRGPVSPAPGERRWCCGHNKSPEPLRGLPRCWELRVGAEGAGAAPVSTGRGSGWTLRPSDCSDFTWTLPPARPCRGDAGPRGSLFAGSKQTLVRANIAALSPAKSPESAAGAAHEARAEPVPCFIPVKGALQREHANWGFGSPQAVCSPHGGLCCDLHCRCGPWAAATLPWHSQCPQPIAGSPQPCRGCKPVRQQPQPVSLSPSHRSAPGPGDAGGPDTPRGAGEGAAGQEWPPRHLHVVFTGRAEPPPRLITGGLKGWWGRGRQPPARGSVAV